MLLQRKQQLRRILIPSSPRVPPKKPSTPSLFDGAPHIPQKDKLKMVERMAVHCIWDKLEKMGFRVYGEQYIGKVENKKKIIDLIAEKDNKFLGIEVKCKETLNTRDFNQFREYYKVLKEKMIPFLVFWVPIPYEYSYFQERGGFFAGKCDLSIEEEKMTQFIYPLFIKVFDFPPFYNIDTALIPTGEKYIPGYEFCTMFEPVGWEELIQSKLDITCPISKEDLNLKQKEANFEHELWKVLRKRGYKLLCQFPVEFPTKTKKRIDLVGVYPKKIACEVKNKVSQSMIRQILEYMSSPTLQEYSIFLAIPKEEEKKLVKFLSILQYFNISVISIDKGKLVKLDKT